MEKKISATEARVHFGELIRKVKEEQQPYIVERDGEPYVVLLSAEAYARLTLPQTGQAWDYAMRLAEESRRRVREELQGQVLPPLDETIREMREERDAQLDEALDVS